MTNREWFDYTEEELRGNPARQREVFRRMIQVLEKHGECRYVFHRLALHLFGDDMDDTHR
jgi:hypothetical protein